MIRNSPEIISCLFQFGDCGVVPFWQVFVELDRHSFFEIFGVITTCHVELLQHADNDIQALGRFCFFDVMPGCFNTLQRNAFADARAVRDDFSVAGTCQIMVVDDHWFDRVGHSFAMKISQLFLVFGDCCLQWIAR